MAFDPHTLHVARQIPGQLPGVDKPREAGTRAGENPWQLRGVLSRILTIGELLHLERKMAMKMLCILASFFCRTRLVRSQ